MKHGLQVLHVLALVELARASTAVAQDRTRAEANEHFEKGVAAFRTNHFSEAIDEFELAYKIAPAYQVLYNIGTVNVALGRHIEAVRALSAYLAEGGRRIPSNRRADVEAELENERRFVGRLTVRVSSDGASILLDGSPLGKSPMGPVFVAIGSHELRVAMVGYAPEVRAIEVAPRGVVTADIKLQPERIEEGPPPPRPVQEDPGGASYPERVSPPRERAPLARRNTAYIVGGAGLAMVIAGGFLAVSGAHDANSAWDRFKDTPTIAAWDEGKAEYDAGNKRNVVGLVLIGVGAAGLGAGAFLFATASREPTAARFVVSPTVSSRAGGIEVAGAW